MTQQTKQPSIDTQFTYVAQRYMENAAPQIKPSSRAKYGANLERYILPVFGERDITGIKRCEIAAFCRDLLTKVGITCKGLSPKSVNGILTLLKALFLFANRELELPVADIRDISVREPCREMRVLSLSEQKKLTRTLLQSPCCADLGILVSLACGLRIGEVCGLQWQDICFDEKTLHVQRTVLRVQAKYAIQEMSQNAAEKGAKTVVLVQPPKSASSNRLIPIPDRLMPILRRAGKSMAGEIYVVSGKRNPTEPRVLEARFQRKAKACGIESVTFHTLRHTMATRCVELGVDVKSLSEILGHSHVSITLERYVHPSMALKHRHMNQLGRLILPGDGKKILE